MRSALGSGVAARTSSAEVSTKNPCFSLPDPAIALHTRVPEVRVDIVLVQMLYQFHYQARKLVFHEEPHILPPFCIKRNKEQHEISKYHTPKFLAPYSWTYLWYFGHIGHIAGMN